MSKTFIDNEVKKRIGQCCVMCNVKITEKNISHDVCDPCCKMCAEKYVR